MMTQVPHIHCLARLLISLFSLTACVEDNDERNERAIDLAPEPELDMSSLNPDREVSDPDAETSPPDLGETARDQEVPEIDAEADAETLLTVWPRTKRYIQTRGSSGVDCVRFRGGAAILMCTGGWR